MCISRRYHLIFNLFCLAALNLLNSAQSETWQINLNFKTDEYQAMQRKETGQEEFIKLGTDPINQLQNLARTLAFFKRNSTQMPEMIILNIFGENNQEERFEINKQEMQTFNTELQNFKQSPIEIPLQRIRQKIQALQAPALEATTQPITPQTTPEPTPIHKDLQDEAESAVRTPIEFSDTPQALSEQPDTYSDDLIAYLAQQDEATSPTTTRFRRDARRNPKALLIGCATATGVFAILGIQKIRGKWCKNALKDLFVQPLSKI